jgi:catalase
VLSPEETVDAINRRYGRHDGARALHAKGILCKGTFTASAGAARLTRAAHMDGGPVEVTVRFSNGSGDPRSRDYDPDVRGMATTFHLPDGSRTDISAQTAPRFPVRRHEHFVELVLAGEPNIRALWRLPLFLVRHPGALGTLRVNAAALRPPPSYANRSYYAIHAFKWVAADGSERYVRYRWVPEDGEAILSRGDARRRGPDYLQEELRERLARAPVRFKLELQVAASGDVVDDPTAQWPADREKLEAGVVEVTSVTDEGDGLVFDPARVTDGIELSDDPILQFRPRAYSVSAERRLS